MLGLVNYKALERLIEKALQTIQYSILIFIYTYTSL